jgi:hypothetical protein
VVIIVGLLVVAALMAFVFAVTPEAGPEITGETPVVSGAAPEAPGGHPLPGVGPDGRA